MRNRFYAACSLLIAALCLPVLVQAQEAPTRPPPDAAASPPPPPPPPPPPAPDPIPPVPQVEFADGVYQMLYAPMTWFIGDSGVPIVVPAGFVHDNASIPKVFRSLLDTHGPYGKAAIVHDYLYWTQLCTRLQADNLLMVAMEESNVPVMTRREVYYGVRLGGNSAFEANRAERMAGGLRVVPEGLRELPATATWGEYLAQLRDQGVHDPDLPASADYCRFGDSVDVPPAPDGAGVEMTSGG